MAFSDFASLISSGIDATSSLINNFIANKQNKNMWQMQADYNSPISQMERFKTAGLNPNLIYSQGTNGNMSSAPNLQANYFPTNAQSAFAHWLQSKMIGKDLQSKDASIRYTNALALNQENQAKLFGTQKNLLEQKYMTEVFKYNNFLPTRSDIFKETLRQLGLRNKTLEYNYDFLLPAQLAFQNAKTQNLKYQTNAVLPSVVRLNNGKLKEIGARVKYLIPAQSRYLNLRGDFQSKYNDNFETLLLTPASLKNTYENMRNFGYKNYTLPFMKSQKWKAKYNNIMTIPHEIRDYQQQNFDNLLRVADFVF